MPLIVRGTLWDHPSRCAVTLRLTCEGEALASRTTQLAPPGVLSFDAGYPLLAALPGPVAGSGPAPACELAEDTWQSPGVQLKSPPADAESAMPRC